VTNTLSYNDAELITATKMFILQAPGAEHIKLFAIPIKLSFDYTTHSSCPCYGHVITTWPRAMAQWLKTQLIILRSRVRNPPRKLGGKVNKVFTASARKSKFILEISIWAPQRSV